MADNDGASPEVKENPTFHGEIRVASRIVDYLSSGLYPSPAACLKELINNAYDADAENVHVYVKPDADRIVIEDDGCGMSKEEFVRHFARISESHKRDTSERTSEFNRPKIGKIGIGFIAANEICELMEIYSTKYGSSELLHVTINFSEMSRPINERRRDGENGEIAKADYEGEVVECSLESHYTHIFLENVRGEAQNILAGAQSQVSESNTRSLYGKSAETIAKELRSGTIKSWKDYDFYSETMLHVALNIPVRYADKWLPSEPPIVKQMEEMTGDLNFNVMYDGTELRKPVVFAPSNDNFLVEPFEFNGKSVSAHGYLYAQHGTIKPPEIQGLLVRIRNSAVGDYDHTFWGFAPTIAQLMQKWISIEIWADDRLEEAMNIDRSTLREAHPAYVELRDALHSSLKKFIEKTRRGLYQEANIVRNQVKSVEIKKEISQALSLGSSRIEQQVAMTVAKTWADQSQTIYGQKALLKKYSVSEFYSVLIEIGRDILDPDQLKELLEKLTDRLTK